MPARRSRSRIHNGVRPVADRPRMTRPANRGQAVPAPSDIGKVASIVAPREARAAAGGELACDANDAEAVAAVRRDIDFEDGVVEPQVLGDAHALRRFRVEQQQAVHVVCELELFGRAEHAVRLYAAELRSADGLAARQLRPNARERRFDAGGNVGRAANHLMPARAVIDNAHG
jgi:hypothetical protein